MRLKQLILLNCKNYSPTENPRVGAEHGPVRFRPWAPFSRLEKLGPRDDLGFGSFILSVNSSTLYPL